MENNNIVHEEWKDVPEYDGKYVVSNTGKVWSNHRGGDMCTTFYDKDGYPSVNLYSYPRIGKQIKIHRLVLLAFVGKKPNGYVCCHNDGNPNNNNLGNLRYDTQKKNHADKLKHGTLQCGERNGKTRLKNSEVIAIKRNHKQFGVENLANFFNYSHSGIQHIISGYTWRHLSWK